MSSNTNNNEVQDFTKMPEQIPIPKGKDLITAVGPGLVLAMTFLGTGDLVSSSVSGANYGYTLIWSLVLALLARTFIVSAIAKYTLLNRFGDTQIPEGYRRLFKFFPLFLAVVVLIAGFVIQSMFLKACATGFYQLTGGNWGGTYGTFISAIIVMVFTIILVASKRQFRLFEYIARAASVTMIVFFVIALFQIGHFDVAGFLRGLFTFQVTADEQSGVFGPLVVACATIGSVAGNMPNLLYSGFMRDKGWSGPRYRKLQQLDLITGMAPLFIINILFWAVAAEHVHASGGSISDEFDMANMMADIMGPIGPFVLWLCIFCAAITSFPTQTRGFAQLAISGIHLGTKGEEKWKGRDEEDPWFKRIQLIVFTIVPIVASLPSAPNMVVLNIIGTSLCTSISLPFIVVGLIWLTSSKKYMMDCAVNKKWETAILVFLGIIAFAITIQLIPQLPGMFMDAFAQ